MVSMRPAAEADQQTIVQIIRAADINPMDLKWQHFVLAIDDETGSIVGTGQIKQHGDGSRELASIATMPSHQHRGIAHQVIEHLLAGSQGRLYLTCLDSLGPFYEQFGFRVVERAEMTPYFRRLTRLAATMMFLTRQSHKLLVMKRD